MSLCVFFSFCSSCRFPPTTLRQSCLVNPWLFWVLPRLVLQQSWPGLVSRSPLYIYPPQVSKRVINLIDGYNTKFELFSIHIIMSYEENLSVWNIRLWLLFLNLLKGGREWVPLCSGKVVRSQRFLLGITALHLTLSSGQLTTIMFQKFQIFRT